MIWITFRKVVIKLGKGQHKVQFVAKKPAEVEVQFRTRAGDTVKFDAEKDVPQVVSFFAKNKPKS